MQPCSWVKVHRNLGSSNNQAGSKFAACQDDLERIHPTAAMGDIQQRGLGLALRRRSCWVLMISRNSLPVGARSEHQ